MQPPPSSELYSAQNAMEAGPGSILFFFCPETSTALKAREGPRRSSTHSTLRRQKGVARGDCALTMGETKTVDAEPTESRWRPPHSPARCLSIS